MILKRIQEPAATPVSLAEAKLHCRVDGTTEDTLITTLIEAATALVENETRRALMVQRWRRVSWGFDSLGIRLPKPPFRSIVSFQYVDTSGDLQTVDVDTYQVDTNDGDSGRLLLGYGKSWPSVRCYEGAVRIEFEAGYADAAAVPSAIRSAILLLVAHWYQNREAVVLSMAIPREMERGVNMLLAPYRDFEFV